MPATLTNLSSGPGRSGDPAEQECLRCYLARIIQARGCDHTRRWTTRWARRRAPHDGTLLDRIENLGGCCCDCEVLLNVWIPREDDDRAGPCAGSSHEDPLVPCRTWGPRPEMLVKEPYEDDGCDDDDAYRSYGEEHW